MKNNISLAGLDYDYYKLNKEKGDLKQALSHLENFVEVLDSVNTVENTINLVEIENKYNHVLLKNENSQLQRANQNKYILLLLILSVCLFLIVIYLLTLKRKNQYINKQQQIIIKQNQEIYAIAIELQQKKEELQQQAIRLEESKRLLHLQDTLEEERTKYELLKDTVDSLNDRLVTLKEERLLQSSVAKKLLKLSQIVKVNNQKTLIPDNYWHTIKEQLTEVYPNVWNELLSKGLTSAEWHICYLTLFKLDTKAMAILLQINPDSVNKQRSRVRQKLDLTGKSTDLYAYLISL